MAYSSPGDPDDADADGLPDSWEDQYFGSNSADPNAIASNGVNTVREAYIAGLDPTNPMDIFTVFNINTGNDGAILQWPGVSGRVYNVEWSTNLLNGFQILETNLLWNQSTITDTLHQVEERLFYRIQVEVDK